MQNGFEDQLAEETPASADLWEDAGDAAQEDALEGAALEDGFEGDEAWDEGDAGDEADAFEETEEAERLEADEAFAEDGLDEGLEEETFAEDGFEDDAGEVGELFAASLDDEDAFLSQLVALARRGTAGALRGGGRAARAAPRESWPWQAAARLVSMLPARNAARLGDVVQALGPQMHRTAPLLGRWASALQPSGVDHMDFYADLAAEDEDADAFVRPLAGLAARYVVRTALSPRARAANPALARAVGRAAARAVQRAARALLQRHGAPAVRAIPRIVRRVARTALQQRASPRALPRMVARAAARVVGSPAAAQRLSRPPPPAVRQVARRVRARAAARPAVSAAAPRPGPARIRRLRLRGPVEIVYRARG